jgi:hypothetical protein
VRAPNAKVVLMGYPPSTPDDSTPPRARWLCKPAVPFRLVAGGALFVLVAAIAAGCTSMDSKQQALDSATTAVRAAAEQARVEVEATLRDPGTGQEQPVDRAARVLSEQISKSTGEGSSGSRPAPTGPSTSRRPSSSSATVAVGSTTSRPPCCCVSA